MRFTFVTDSADADIHVTWTEQFTDAISGKTLWARDRHWWIVNGTITIALHHNGGEVLEWLTSGQAGEIGIEADLTRVAMTGHSQGGAAALSYQGDPRVDTIIAWDISDGIADANTSQPIMYQRTDGAPGNPFADLLCAEAERRGIDL